MYVNVCRTLHPSSPSSLLLLCSKHPKVCTYLNRTFNVLEKSTRKLKTSDVWEEGVDESFLFTMTRYHSRDVEFLRPLIKASDPAFHAPEPWANLLWLGLGADAAVLRVVSCVSRCTMPPVGRAWLALAASRASRACCDGARACAHTL